MIIVFISAKGSPWKKGFQESFYSQFKVSDQFEIFGELVEAIYLQIDYYDKSRIHTSLKMSPVKFKVLYCWLNVNYK